MIFRISQNEKRDLLKAWGAISFAFAVLFGGGFAALLAPGFIVVFAIAGVTVGAGFVAHELSHKLVAQKYGCSAEFRSFDRMLMLAILFSFFGFVIAAPGGVFIKGRVSPARNGKISAAGIVANIVVAFLFFSLGVIVAIPAVKLIAFYGMIINSWLALFNLIPILGFDGKKVLAWNKLAYAALVAAALVLMSLSRGIGVT